MKMNFNPDNLIKIISDKEGLIRMLLEMTDRNFNQLNGCLKLRESLKREDPNLSPENIAHCTAVALATSAKNSEDIMNISQLLLVYCSSSKFDLDVALMANKFGKGQEAARAMFKNKLNGQ